MAESAKKSGGRSRSVLRQDTGYEYRHMCKIALNSGRMCLPVHLCEKVEGEEFEDCLFSPNHLKFL